MSNEWLTTGEMIDRLKVGEVAENDTRRTKVYYRGATMRYDSGNVKGHEFFIMKHPADEHWRILPNYVSFDEAMRALKEGKTVKASDHEGYYIFNEADCINDTFDPFSTWGDLFYFNWVIED